MSNDRSRHCRVGLYRYLGLADARPALEKITMTKCQYMQKIRSLLRTQNRAILVRAENLWRSGAFDSNDFDNDFQLPKAVVYVLDKEMADNWRPLVDCGLIKNLECF